MARFSLKVLGTCSLQTESGEAVQSVLAQPRRFALLVYLAIESRSGPIRRERILNTFWPESSPDKGRGALNQAVFYLRRSLGANTILTHASEELELAQDVIETDVVRFLDAVEARDWRRAAELYTGELLPGFYISGDAEFESWLSQVQEQLRSHASMAAWKLSARAEEQGDMHETAVWARRAARWATGDEVVLRRLMETLDRLGDRSGVLESYDSLRRSLAPLGADPSVETEELLARIRARWAAQDAARASSADSSPTVAELAPGPKGPGAETKEGQKKDPTHERGAARPLARAAGPFRRGRAQRSFVLMSLAVGVFLATAGFLAWKNRQTALETRIPWVMVEKAEGAASEDETALLLAETLRQFQGISRLRVLPGDGVGQPTQADYVLRAVVGRQADKLRLTGYLLDAASGAVLATFRAEREAPELTLELADTFAIALTSFARRTIGRAEAERALYSADVPTRARELMRLARADRQRADSLRAAGAVGASQVAYGRADSTYQVVSQIVPKWSPPYTQRATTAYQRVWLDLYSSGGKIEMALARLRHSIGLADSAIARNRSDLDAFEIRAMAALLLWQLAERLPSESPGAMLLSAEQDARLVTRQDPTRAQAWSVLGAALAARGEYAEAYWALQRAYAENADLRYDAEILLRLFMAAFESGDLRGAETWCQMVAARPSVGWARFHCQLMLLMEDKGMDAAARADSVLAEAQEAGGWSMVHGYLEAIAAAVHARFGNTVRAQTLLESSRQAAERDTGILPHIASALLILGEIEAAREALDTYVQEAPETRKGILRQRYFQGLK